MQFIYQIYITIQNIGINITDLDWKISLNNSITFVNTDVNSEGAIQINEY